MIVDYSVRFIIMFSSKFNKRPLWSILLMSNFAEYVKDIAVIIRIFYRKVISVSPYA